MENGQTGPIPVLSEGARRSIAAIRHGMASSYMQDLCEYQAGDINRFIRMVGRQGEPSGSLQQWISHLAAICEDRDVQEFYPELAEVIRENVIAIGLEWPEEEK